MTSDEMMTAATEALAVVLDAVADDLLSASEREWLGPKLLAALAAAGWVLAPAEAVVTTEKIASIYDKANAARRDMLEKNVADLTDTQLAQLGMDRKPPR